MLGQMSFARSASVAALAAALCLGFAAQPAKAQRGVAAGVAAGVILGAVVAGAASSRARATPAPRQRTVKRTKTTRAAKANRSNPSGPAEASNNPMIPSDRGKAVPASGSGGDDPFAKSQQVKQAP